MIAINSYRFDCSECQALISEIVRYRKWSEPLKIHFGYDIQQQKKSAHVPTKTLAYPLFSVQECCEVQRNSFWKLRNMKEDKVYTFPELHS